MEIPKSVKVKFRIFTLALAISSILHILTLKTKVNVTENNICNVYLTSKFVLRKFALALIVSEILLFQMDDLEKVGQGNGVQDWQW